MKRTLAWIAGLAGVAALGRLLARRRAEAVPGPEAMQEPATIDPASELRSKLAEQRDDPPAAANEPGETLEERRARVHGQAQDAIDAMREGGSS